MKSRLYIIFIAFMGCKKSDNVQVRQISAVNVVHAVIGLEAIKIAQTNSYGSFSSLPSQLSYGTSSFCYYQTGEQQFSVFRLSDSLLLLNTTINLEARVNSMFIIGDEAGKIDTIFHKESKFPFTVTDLLSPPAKDSLIFVRFVNLSPNSPSLKITQASSPDINEVSGLNYRGITEFKPYPARLEDPKSYVFQVRNDLDNSLLASVSISITAANRFKCMAVIIRGKIGEASPYNLVASRVNYY